MIQGRILVVDDDREVLRLIRAYLEDSGFEVLVAHNGESSIHTIRRERPDLVLLDLMLPDRDGWDVTRTIRNDAVLKNTPIIMLTARVDDTDKIVGLEMGADDYVTKPYNPREVVARVKARLRIQQGLKVDDPNQVLSVNGLRMDIRRREVLVHDRVVSLTATEFEILRVLMEEAGYVLTRGELIARRWAANSWGLNARWTAISEICALRLNPILKTRTTSKRSTGWAIN